MSILSCYYRFDELAADVVNDNTYHFSERSAAQAVEIDIGIIFGCVPILPALANKSVITTWFNDTFTSLRRLVKSRKATSGDVSSTKAEAHYNLPDGGHRQASNRSMDSTVAVVPLRSIKSPKTAGRVDVRP